MRKEPIYYYDKEKNKFLIEGFEILADFPHLLSNPEIDYKTFITHLEGLKSENKNYVYHLNINLMTLEKYIDKVIESVKSHPLKDKIVVEILEETHKKIDSFIEKFYQNGIRLSIDDFGTESANFDRLIKHSNVIESVKVDRVVWKNFGKIVKAIVESQIVNDANIKVIAEKVETEEEIKTLISKGVRYFQGWYFKNYNFIYDKIENLNTAMEDPELLLYLFDKTLRLYKYNSIDELIKTFKAVVIAHSLSIPIDNNQNFEKILNEVFKEEKNPTLNLDEISEKTVEKLSFVLASIDSLKMVLNKFKPDKFQDYEDYQEYVDFNKKIKMIKDDINKHILELKLLLSRLDLDKTDLKNLLPKRKFINLMKYNFNKKVNTTILYLYFPSLKEIFSEKGAYYYKTVLDFIIDKLNYFLPKDVPKSLIDNHTIGIGLEGNISKNKNSIESLKRKFSNLSVQVDKKFVDLNPKMAYTDFKESDKDSEDPILRIESLHYELINLNTEVSLLKNF